MRYGVDLDGVCFDFLNAFRKHLNGAFDLNLQEHEITNYYWHEGTDGLTEDGFMSELHNFGKAGGYRDLSLLPGTIDALERIENSGGQIFYITNRPEYVRADTMAALKEHGFPFSKNLFFALGDKSSLINKLNIGVFIEDSGDTIMDIAHGTNAYVYCVNYVHNRNVEHPNVERIDDWDDFLLAESI